MHRDDESCQRWALLEGPAFVSAVGSGGGLAAEMASRAVAYGDQLYTELDVHGIETSVPISSLHERAWSLVPVLGSVASAESAVVVCVERVLEYVPAAWACIFSGRTFLSWAPSAVTARDTQTKAKLEFVTGKLNRPVLVTTRAVSERLQLVESGRFGGVVFVDDVAYSDAAGSAAPGLQESVSLLDDAASGKGAAVLSQTSGSTGIPKLVDIRHEQMLNRFAVASQIVGDDQCLNLRPFDAAFAPLYQLFVKPTGLVYVSPERAFANPRDVLGLVDRHRIRHISSTSSFFAKLIETLDRQPYRGDLSCLRSVEMSGELTSREVAAGVRERLRGVGAGEVQVRFIYGSSEAGYVSTIADTELAQGPTSGPVSAEVSQGPPCDGIGLRVVDEGGALMRQGEVGEIEIRSASQMFSGYYGDPDATSTAFLPRVPSCVCPRCAARSDAASFEAVVSLPSM